MRLTCLVAAIAVFVSIVINALVVQQHAAVAPNQLDMPVRLKAGNEFIDTGKEIAHAGPLAVDLDADGKSDLLVGNFLGHFQVYMNTGTREEPEYEDKGFLEADGETAKVPNW